jgi:hypothetical protein
MQWKYGYSLSVFTSAVCWKYRSPLRRCKITIKISQLEDRLAPAFPPKEWEETEDVEEWSHSDSKRGVTRVWGGSQMSTGHKVDRRESRDRRRTGTEDTG